MALALYRKYRPAKFAEVVGQEHVTEPLGTALAAGRINHAYLFSGPRGCGKTSSARILARSLNCELGPTPDPCGVCPSCIALAPEGPGSIDVVELDAASHGGVDDARELRDRAFYAPAESRYRVFIVDEAHMVTTQGFNALLKIVEEPPDHLVFVFATTEPDKVLATIRSRTHHYPFRLIPPGTLRALLERICAEEGVSVAPAVYPLVIRAGGGSARDTLSVLDQLIAGAGPEGVTYERAMALLGVTDVALVDDAVDALAAGDAGAVYETVDRLVEAGHDPRRFAADLLQRVRDLLLLQAVPEAAAHGIVEAADDELARMVEQAGKVGPATLHRYGDILHAGLTEMRGATAPRLLLELLCARMLLPAASTTDAALLERLERLERRAAIEAPPEPGASTAAAEAGSGRRQFVRPTQARGDAAPAVQPGRDAGVRPPAGGPIPAVQGASDAGAAAPQPRRSPAPDATHERPADDAPRQDASRSEPPVPPEDAGWPAGSESGPSAAPAAGRPDTGSGPGAGQGAGEPGVSAAPAARSGAEARPAGQPAAGASGRADASGPQPGATEPATGPGAGAAQSAADAAGRADTGRRPLAASATTGPRSDPAGEPAGAGERSDPAARRPEPEPGPIGGGAIRPAVPADPAGEPPVEPPSAAGAPAGRRTGGLDAAAVRRVWPEILAATKQRKMRTHALLVTATVRTVDDDTLVLAAGTPALARLLSEPSNLDIIADALNAVLGVGWRVRCESGETPPPAQAPSRPRQPPPSRESRAPQRQSPPARGRRPATDDGVPLPPEPPADEPPPDDEEAMMAEAAADVGEPVSRRDPEEAAIELLTAELGARALDRP